MTFLELIVDGETTVQFAVEKLREEHTNKRNLRVLHAMSGGKSPKSVLNSLSSKYERN